MSLRGSFTRPIIPSQATEGHAPNLSHCRVEQLGILQQLSAIRFKSEHTDSSRFTHPNPNENQLNISTCSKCVPFEKKLAPNTRPMMMEENLHHAPVTHCTTLFRKRPLPKCLHSEMVLHQCRVTIRCDIRNAPCDIWYARM